jgi:hypothetical protein
MSVPTRVLAWYLKQGPKGGTVDDCCKSLALGNYSTSSAVSRLVRAGHLVRTADARTTRMKRRASVYVHTNFVQTTPVAAKQMTGTKKTEGDVLRIFWRYVETRKKAGKDDRAIQRALMKMMKDLAVAAER